MHKSVNKLDYIEYKENLTGKYTLSMNGKLVEKLLIWINKRISDFWVFKCRFLEMEYANGYKEALINKQYRTTPLDENYYLHMNNIEPKHLQQ